MWYTTQNTRQTKKCLVTKGSQTEPNNLKENIMFDFTKTTKQYEELATRIKEVNEFWINAVISSLKQFIK